MKIDKLNLVFNNKLKKYFLYALGEIILIVTGILIAMRVDNYNATRKYENVMDQNFKKVANELKINLYNSKIGIDYLKKQDSIIRLIMLDSFNEMDYRNQRDLAGISMTFMNSMIGVFDYNNLLNYNVSDKQYHSDLILNLRNTYGYRDFMIENEGIIKKFVKENSIPFFSKNVESFEQYLYFEKQNDALYEFLLTSKDYKELLSHYAQLNYHFLLSYQMFYENGILAYEELAKQYELEPINPSFNNISNTQISGKYLSLQLQDTTTIIEENDTLFVINGKNKKKLIYLNDNQFFYKLNDGMYPFLTFKNDSIFHVHSKALDFQFYKVK